MGGSDDRLSRIVLCGGGSYSHGLQAALKQELGVQVQQLSELSGSEGEKAGIYATVRGLAVSGMKAAGVPGRWL